MDNQNVNQPAEMDTRIKKWNWGAFAYNIWWGIGNKTYLPLLCLIPFVGVIMIFVCGAKGNEWAWNNNSYRDVEEFLRVQETWNRAGFISFIVGVIMFVITIGLSTVLGLGFAQLMSQYDYY